MMQAERDKRAIESVGFERQLIRLAGALQIVGNRFLMVMTDVKHRLGLVDPDDFSAFDLFGQRPGDAPRARRQIQHELAAFKRQHFD